MARAENVWIGQAEDGQAYMHHSEPLINSNVEGGVLKRTYYLAFDKNFNEAWTPLASSSREQASKQEL